MKLEPLKLNDLSSLAALQPPDWTDILPQFDYYIRSTNCLPIKAVENNIIAGVGASIIHNDVAWLAHIIVHPDYRKQGIGEAVTKALIEEFQSRKCTTVYLIATELGEPVYRKIGFEAETEYIYFKDLSFTAKPCDSVNIIKYSAEYRKQLFDLDRKVTGENREWHLEAHLKNGLLYVGDQTLEGYFLSTFGGGVIIAQNSIAGIELMKVRLKDRNDAAFPIDNQDATQFLQHLGYRSHQTAKKMRFGKRRNWQPSNIYNRTGGNIG